MGDADVRRLHHAARLAGARRRVPGQPAQRSVHRRLARSRLRRPGAEGGAGDSRSGTPTCSAACRTSPPCTATSSIPTALLRLLLPTDAGMTWGFIIHLFLAGLLHLRVPARVGLRLLPVARRRHRVHAERRARGPRLAGPRRQAVRQRAAAADPWFLVRGIRDGRLWAWGGVAIAVGLAVLSPHPQLLQYLLLTCGAFALYLAFADDAGRRKAGAQRRRGAARLGARPPSRVGFLIGAVQYLPVLRVRAVVATRRREGLGARRQLLDADRGAAQHLSAAVQRHPRAILGSQRHPLPQRVPRRGDAPARVRGRSSAARARKGVPAVLDRRAGRLACSGRSAASRRSTTSSTPSCRARSSSARRAPCSMVVALATAVLAALGTERALAGGLTRRYLVGWVVARAASIALLGDRRARSRRWRTRSPRASPFDRAAVDRREHGRRRARRPAQPAVPRRRGRTADRCGRAAESTRVRWGGGSPRSSRSICGRSSGKYWIFSPPASVLYASDPAIEYLKKAEPGRVVVAPAVAGGTRAARSRRTAATR